MNNGDKSQHPFESKDKKIQDQKEDIERYFRNLELGALSQEDQKRLHRLITAAPPSVIMTAIRQETFIGPLPPPEQLSQYDTQTRETILSMAQNEQAHVHSMRLQGLKGAIAKDKRGQYIGGTIAITGLIVAAIIAPYSAVAAAVIGSLDLFGMVALFVAPRLLEKSRNSSHHSN